MKRFIIILLSLFLIVGCSNSVNDDDSKDSKSKSDDMTEVTSDKDEDNQVVDLKEINEKEDKSEHEELPIDKYLEILRSVYDLYDAEIKLLKTYFDEAERNKVYFTDEKWINGIEESFERLALTHVFLNELLSKNMIPKEYTEVHELTLEPFRTLEMVKSLFEISTDKEQVYDNSIEYFKLSDREITESTNKLKEVIRK